MARPDLYTMFNRIIPVEVLKVHDYLRLKSPGFMDLIVEVLQRRGDILWVSMAHYFEVNGDLVPDPDCELEIDLGRKTLRPLAIQTSFGPYTKAVTEDAQGNKVVHHVRLRDLSDYLKMWLSNLEAQNFAYRPEPGDESSPKDEQNDPLHP